MSDFKSMLQETSAENTEEKKKEKMKQAYLNHRNELLDSIYENIKSACISKSQNGETRVRFYLNEIITSVIDSESEDVNFLLKHPGAGYENTSRKVLKDPEYLKNYLLDKLAKDGLTDVTFVEKEIPIYEIQVIEQENSTSVKALSAGLNLFLGANLNVNTTTKRKRKEIGKQIIDYAVTIEW